MNNTAINTDYNSLLTDLHNKKVVGYIDAGDSPLVATTKADNEMFSLLTAGDLFAGQEQPDLTDF